ncbi:MAG: potassium channel family protein [Candidatus Korobacteraceae bacterium]
MTVPENPKNLNRVMVIGLYVVAALTVAAFGYGVGGPVALRAGVLYALAGLVLGCISVGFAPRFVIVVALATGLLGSILRAAAGTEVSSLFPKQSTVEYLRIILTICGAISFGGGLYGGFRFTNHGLFNWISRLIIAHNQPISILDTSPRSRLMLELSRHFYASERMYFSLLTAFGSVLIAKLEIEPARRSLAIVFLAVLINNNLAWGFGAWLKPRITVLGNIFRILRQMWEALAAFLLGYGALVFIFACFYSAAWRFDPVRAFRGVDASHHPSFADFVYFSVVTMSTVGYGDVIPANALTRSLACIEVVFGIGWVTVVLSAAAALVRPKVDLVLKREWEEVGEHDPDMGAAEQVVETKIRKAAS